MCINGLNPTDTLSVLIQKLKDKEGIDDDKEIIILFRGKQLSGTSLTKPLNSLGIKARSNLSVAFKVLGGMQVYDSAVTTQRNQNNRGLDIDVAGNDKPKVRRFNARAAAKVGIKATKQNCFVGAHYGCEDPSVSKLAFAQCNHTYCADCVFYYLTC